MNSNSVDYRIGIMNLGLGSQESETQNIIELASEKFEKELRDLPLKLSVEVLSFPGSSLTLYPGNYSPLDLLQLGISENIEQNFHMLFLVTDADILAKNKPYTLALPSPITRIGVISTVRIAAESESKEKLINRLSALFLHIAGHIWTIDHASEKGNVMFDFTKVSELDLVTGFSDEQLDEIESSILNEGEIEVTSKNFPSFIFRNIMENLPDLSRVLRRANPFSLAIRMPTMLTAALSVTIVLFFSSETWDLASTVEFYQLVIFSLGALILATLLLYRTFTFGPVFTRTKALTESTVIAEAAVFSALIAMVISIGVSFFGFFLLTSRTIFPHKLMETWPTVDPAIKLLDHIKLSLFLSGMAIITGSLGGRAESKDVIRYILFIEEET